MTPSSRSNFLLVTVAFCLLPCLFSSAAHADLRVVPTAHYRIETDLVPELADDLSMRLDVMYAEYAGRLPRAVEKGKATKKLHVYLFRKRADYLHLVGERFTNTGGLYVSGRNFLAAFLEGQGRDGLRRTLQHEAFHQFVHEAMPNGIPVWLNEGMAQFYEEGLWTGSDFWTGQVPPRRVRQLQLDLKKGRMSDFATLGALTSAQWAQVFTGEMGKGATQYNHAWAMVYFLLHFKDETGREPYKNRLADLFQSLQDGADNRTAFARIFPDAATIQEKFLVYAQKLAPTPDATLIERQSVLGDLVIALRSREAIPDTFADIRKLLMKVGYRIRYTQDEVKWDSDADVTIYFSDMAGRPFSNRQLTLEPRAGAPMPDIVCRCFDHHQLRTRFYNADGKVEHEILVQPLTTAP